jgi:hypothetical protein
MPSESGSIARQRGQFVPATRHNLLLGINQFLPISGEVGFHNCRIDPHTSTRHNSLVDSDFDDPLMNLLEHLRPHRHAPAPYGLGVRHLATTYPREVAVDQVGAHFTLEDCIAPIADMLEN